MSLIIPNEEPLVRQKELAENAVSEAFARDLITIEELEKRLHQIQGSHSNSELSLYVRDLPENVLTPRESPIQNPEKKQTTILSSTTLRGAKLKKKKLRAKVVLGEQIFDYSKTVLEPGKYYVHLTVVLSDTKIIVPPEYAVTAEISGILSEVKDKSAKAPDPNAPEIIITGKAILSSVSIKVKNSGIIEKIKQLLTD